MPTPLDRVFEAAGCRTQVKLAEFLGIRQSSISDAKKRSSIPPEWLVKLVVEKNVSPGWILSGKGPRFLVPLEGENKFETNFAEEKKEIQDFSTDELILEIYNRAVNFALLYRKIKIEND